MPAAVKKEKKAAPKTTGKKSHSVNSNSSATVGQENIPPSQLPWVWTCPAPDGFSNSARNLNLWNRPLLPPRQELASYLLETQQKQCEDRIAAVERRAEQEIERSQRQNSYAAANALLRGYY